MSNKIKNIIIEGVYGAGKSSLKQGIQEYLINKGFQVYSPKDFKLYEEISRNLHELCPSNSIPPAERILKYLYMRYMEQQALNRIIERSKSSKIFTIRERWLGSIFTERSITQTELNNCLQIIKPLNLELTPPESITFSIFKKSRKSLESLSR